MRKSTDGFSIGNVLLDFGGGMANYAQMATQSIDQSLSSFPNSLQLVFSNIPIGFLVTVSSVFLSRFLGEFLWEHWQSIAIPGMHQLIPFFIRLPLHLNTEKLIILVQVKMRRHICLRNSSQLIPQFPNCVIHMQTWRCQSLIRVVLMAALGSPIALGSRIPQQTNQLMLGIAFLLVSIFLGRL